jgi:hypothetical protein
VKKLIYLFPVLSAILIGGGSKAHAQVIGELKASIPFEFHAGGATLPAGVYTFNVLEGADNNTVEVRNTDMHNSVLIETRNAHSKALPKASELLFNHTDGSYYLARIFDQEDKDGLAVFDSSYRKKFGPMVAPVDQKDIATVYKTN